MRGDKGARGTKSVRADVRGVKCCEGVRSVRCTRDPRTGARGVIGARAIARTVCVRCKGCEGRCEGCKGRCEGW